MSHDRRFLDNVVTQTLVAESRGGSTGTWYEYPGGYSDWLDQRPPQPKGLADTPARAAGAKGASKAADAPTAGAKGASKAAGASSSRPGAPRKLTFAERRELDALPDDIEALEREQHALTERMSRPDYHREGGDRIKADRARAAEIEHALAAKFERWAELDSRKDG